MKHWLTVNDDQLQSVDKAVRFLQNEFCPEGADPMWSAEYFLWKLGPANPAGNGYFSLAMLEDEVVGTISLTKKRLLINGTECIGAEWGDGYSSAVVRREGRAMELSPMNFDPDAYINKSIFGRLVFETRVRAEVNGLSILYGTPNKYAYSSWTQKLDFYAVTSYSNKSFSRPTANFIVKKFPHLKFMRVFFQGMEMTTLSLQKFFSGMSQDRNFTIEPIVPLADEIDNLWARVKPVNGFSFVRDAAYWRHRYLEHPLAKYTFFSIREANQLVGMVVARLSCGGDGRRVVHIMEWMNESHKPFGYILSTVMDYYRNFEVDLFNFWAGKSTEEAKAAVRSLFFSRRSAPIIFPENACGRSLEAMATNFKFYLGSSDAA